MKDLETQVNNIREYQSRQNTSRPQLNSETAMQMFHARLQQLEKEKENHSDEEKEVLKTPIANNEEDQKKYLKKLKNTIRVYKGRCKDFEKRR